MGRSIKKVVSVLVDNEPGVLARITSLFGRRGYNIESLTVSATNVKSVSRITIVIEGDEHMLNQMIGQTSKLHVVQDIFTLNYERSVVRELLLVKVAADESNRGALTEIANVYKAKIVDLSIGSMILELTGEQNKLDGFLSILSEYSIMEVCRTGITALSRGAINNEED
ncbi:MAG: acetolactate synthase small subunit [Firmicutes bacterium]|nr:acetolactate synthase small subunit [Bacillota bacterium]